MAKQYIISCWHCRAEFNAFEATFCFHQDPSKICPFCLNCSCHAPQEYKDKIISESPSELLAEKKNYSDKTELKLGEILLRAGKISEEDLELAMEKQAVLKKRLGEILIMLDLITPEELNLYLIDQKWIEKIDLKKQSINYDLIDRIGWKLILDKRFLPLETFYLGHEEILTIALSSKNDLPHLKDTIELRSFKLVPYLADSEEMDEILNIIKDKKR